MHRLGRLLVLGALVGSLLMLAPPPPSAAPITAPPGRWKVDLAGATVRESSPTLADLDADGTLEILFGAHDSKVWAVHGTTGRRSPGGLSR